MKNVECGMKNVECGMKNVECGMKNVECGMKNVECGMKNVENVAAVSFVLHSAFSILLCILHSPFCIDHSTLAPMSIRLRLTLLYSAVLALMLIGLSVALYATVSRVTLGAIEDTLVGEAQRLVGSRDFDLNRIDYQARKFAAPETEIQTIRLDGSGARRTANPGDL